MTFWKRSQEGYLLIDHSASPGIPEDVARQLKLDPAQVGEGKVLEAATLTCSHCKVVVMKNPLRTRERASCAKCGHHYICDFCAIAARQPDYSHLPYEKLRDETLELGLKGIVLGSPRELMDQGLKGLLQNAAVAEPASPAVATPAPVVQELLVPPESEPPAGSSTTEPASELVTS